MPGPEMTSELEALAAAARLLADASGPSSPVADAAAELAQRLDAGRFAVAVCGAFNRGKSTVCNALLGIDVLPAGVLPLTAVATELSFGSEHLAVVHLDGTTKEANIAELADYVTEERNPDNERKVARVEIRIPADVLQSGAVLVDTPGLESIFLHNSEAARQAIVDADGAVVVLSADAPLGEGERDLLELIAERSARTFFVLNRVDHLQPPEVERVRDFVESALHDILGRPQRVFCVSARAALDAKLGRGEVTDPWSQGWREFEDEFTQFLRDDLVAARVDAASAQLSRLVARADTEFQIEEAALRLSTAELDERIEQFRHAVGEQRRASDEDHVLLDDATARIADDLSRTFAAIAGDVPAVAIAELERVAASVGVRSLELALDDTVEAAVQARFDDVRVAEADRVEHAWHAAADEFRRRTQQRVDELRGVASELFTVDLSPVEVPRLTAKRERFFYLFLHFERPEQAVARWLMRSTSTRAEPAGTSRNGSMPPASSTRSR
jgi:GTP-binding protein EngB required for normal cell division